MAETAHESSFWLPSDFLTDDDFRFPPNLTKTSGNNNHNFPAFLTPSPPLFRRSSSALTSPGESVETDTSFDDDPDEFIAELTRHLALSSLRDRPPHPHEKAWGPLATSPQSTLTGFPTWSNRRRSTPAFDANDDDSWELIYAAAERIAKLKLTCQAQILKQRHMEFQQIKNQQFLRNRVTSEGNVCLMRAQQQQSNRHHLNHHHACTNNGPAMRAVYLNSGIKKQSAGTGVFIPRQVGSPIANAPTETRKKQGIPTVLMPARVVQALNLNIDEMNGHAQPQPCFNHDILMARRNGGVMVGQQQRRGIRGEPLLLPQEWTY